MELEKFIIEQAGAKLRKNLQVKILKFRGFPIS